MCKRGRERILHGTPTEKRNISRSFILFERLGGLWQGPIMIGYVYEAAGVHHLKFDSWSTTERGFMHFKAFKCHDDFWGKVTRARTTIIIIRRKQVSLCQISNYMLQYTSSQPYKIAAISVSLCQAVLYTQVAKCVSWKANR